jgi:hypothetical protein
MGFIKVMDGFREYYVHVIEDDYELVRKMESATKFDSFHHAKAFMIDHIDTKELAVVWVPLGEDKSRLM